MKKKTPPEQNNRIKISQFHSWDEIPAVLGKTPQPPLSLPGAYFHRKKSMYHEFPLLGVSWGNEWYKVAQGYIYWQMKFKEENKKYQNQLTSKTYEQLYL